MSLFVDFPVAPQIRARVKAQHTIPHITSITSMETRGIHPMLFQCACWGIMINQL